MDKENKDLVNWAKDVSKVIFIEHRTGKTQQIHSIMCTCSKCSIFRFKSNKVISVDFKNKTRI